MRLLVTGLYCKQLPQQNRAPLRLVVPWKYGFKNIRSFIQHRFGERVPQTAWHRLQPSECKFVCNVHPDVDHPRAGAGAGAGAGTGTQTADYPPDLRRTRSDGNFKRPRRIRLPACAGSWACAGKRS